MSPRIKVIRKVTSPPLIKGFRPYGALPENHNSELINLLYEEYEAIRLSDYDLLNHMQASVMMGVSRPTFTRIYASALQKMAKAMVEGRQISIEGGKVYFDSDWYQCDSCHCNFNNPEKDKVTVSCPLCGNHQISSYTLTHDENQVEIQKSNDVCYCPQCGYEENHQVGQPCNQQACPKCNSTLKRKSKIIIS